MKFIGNTAPIVSGLDLAIISSNISKFYQKSCIVELTIEPNGLRVNTEASSVKSELVFKGAPQGDGPNHIFVDSLLFKNLLKTIETDLVEFVIEEDRLTVVAGKGNFHLPKVVSADEMELVRPVKADSVDTTDIDSSAWAFVKDHQMYAIAMSFIYPVYTNVWLGKDGDVLVGDFDNSIFTHSTKVGIDTTCLLTDTIVNLLTTVPENSKIVKIGKSYEIEVLTDPYSYLCEFTPKYETDEGVGEYSSDAIFGLFNADDRHITVNTKTILKYISQAELFTTSNDELIKVEVEGNTFTLVNTNVKCNLTIDNPFDPFSISFSLGLLKDVISHMDKDEVYVTPLIQGTTAVGLIFRTDDMEAVLAGAE